MGCDVNVPTYHGSNCLLIAAGSSLDLVRYLFEKYHHNPNVVNGFGENAAFVAARYGQFDVFKYILSVVDTDVFLVNKSGLDIY